LKKTKVSIVLISIIMVTALVLTSLALAQDDNYPLSEEDASKNDGTVRYVVEGSFNVTENGDIVETYGTTDEHWKRIVVPQLTLENMPLIRVYYKPNNSSASTHEMWRESGEALGTFPTLSVVYDEQSVLILYKKVYNDCGITNYLFNGEYKIVVIK